MNIESISKNKLVTLVISISTVLLFFVALSLKSHANGFYLYNESSTPLHLTVTFSNNKQDYFTVNPWKDQEVAWNSSSAYKYSLSHIYITNG